MWSFSSDEGTCKQRDKEKGGMGILKLISKFLTILKEPAAEIYPGMLPKIVSLKRFADYMVQ